MNNHDFIKEIIELIFQKEKSTAYAQAARALRNGYEFVEIPYEGDAKLKVNKKTFVNDPEDDDGVIVLEVEEYMQLLIEEKNKHVIGEDIDHVLRRKENV